MNRKSRPPEDSRSFADGPQRNPKRDDIQDEGSRELFINNPEHPLKVAQKKNTPSGEAVREEGYPPDYHPKPTPKVRRSDRSE